MHEEVRYLLDVLGLRFGSFLGFNAYFGNSLHCPSQIGWGGPLLQYEKLKMKP